MKLYHGCSAESLRSILTGGLCPRLEKRSNWKKAPSRTDMVYLTVAYPFYFALSHRGFAAVVEIDTKGLNHKRFFPDEDFIALVLSRQEGKELGAVHGTSRDSLDAYQNRWRLSLGWLGNCCYQGTIPPRCITRYCLFNPEARPELAAEMRDDPLVNLTNYAAMGQSYRRLVAWMFGDRKVLPMVADTGKQIEAMQKSPVGREFLDAAQKQLALWQKESGDRTGIRCIPPPSSGFCVVAGHPHSTPVWEAVQWAVEVALGQPLDSLTQSWDIMLFPSQPGARIMAEKINKTQAVKEYLKGHRKAKNQEVVDALAKKGIKISASYVASIKTTHNKRRGAMRKVVAKGNVGIPEVKAALAFVKLTGSVAAAKQALAVAQEIRELA